MGAHTFTITGMAGTFDAGIGTSTPVEESAQQVNPVITVVDAHARLSVGVGTPAEPELVMRATAGVSLAMPDPFYINGQASVPKYSGRAKAIGDAITGIGHIRSFADPDPVWTGTGWEPEPPTVPAGSNFIRWTARQLPDPAAQGGKYLLGTRVADDGTLGLPAGAEQWNADDGSDFAIPWQSAWPFKPWVQAHVHYGEDGFIHTVDRAVHLTPHRCAHMWGDLGSILAPPFTVLAVVLVTDFPGRGYLNYLFDAGGAPAISDAQRGRIWAHGVRGDLALAEAEGYRNVVRIGREQVQAFNDPAPAGRIARAPFEHTLKPKVIALKVAGVNSRLFVAGSGGTKSRTVSLGNLGEQRLWLLGRKNGRISSDSAASIVVFEIRMWDQPLSDDDLEAQFDQLSSTWNFQAYDRQIRNHTRDKS